jgi:hypothetical protein
MKNGMCLTLTFPLKNGKRNKPFEPVFAIIEEHFREQKG